MKLHQMVMQKKVADGSTHLTRIHHRESPLRILLGKSDVIYTLCARTE